MTLWTPDVSSDWIITVIVIQGAGIGMVFMPLQLIAFATLSPALRGDGAAAMSLTRNIGMAIGTSGDGGDRDADVAIRACGAELFRDALFAHVFTSGAMALVDPRTPHGAEDDESRWWIVRRASSVTGDAFKALMLSSVPCIFLLFLMRKPKAQLKKPDPSDAHVAMD